MTEHLSQRILAGYHGRELTAPELIAVDEHLAVCETCRANLGRAEQADERSHSLIAGLHREAQEPLQHLSYEDLEAYVGETLSETEREIVVNHLQVCALCDEEAQDLLAFKTSIERQKREPVAAPAGASRRWFEGWRNRFQMPAYRMILQAAAVCLLAAITGLLVLLPLKRQAAELQAQLDQLQQENLELRQRSAALTDVQAQLDSLREEHDALLLSQPVNELPEKTLALKDAGGTVTLDEEGRLQGLAALSPANQQLIKNALRSGRAGMPATISEVTAKAGVLMSGASAGVSFALQKPIGTFVQSPRPLFRWQEVKGATSYIVTIYDAGFRAVAKSEEVMKTEWAPAEDLERGVTYRWQVTANVDGGQMKSPVPPAPEARFRIIDSATLEEMQRARQLLAGSHLGLGLLYAQAGLLDDAERELQLLMRANPQANVARRLLQSVKARRR